MNASSRQEGLVAESAHPGRAGAVDWGGLPALARKSTVPLRPASFLPVGSLGWSAVGCGKDAGQCLSMQNREVENRLRFVHNRCIVV